MVSSYNLRSKKDAGFTLVELSISIIIMGLLVASVIVAREMLSGARIRALIGEFETHKLAIEHFKEQYVELPGDLSNAESFFGTYPGDSEGTINGNGDGKIDPDETFTFWSQLSKAKLVAGKFNGGDNSSNDAQLDVNVPRSINVSGGFSFIYSAGPGGWVDAMSNGFRGNYMILGNQVAGSYLLSGGALTPSEAASVDRKLDSNDQPDYGNVLAVNGNGTTDCTTDVAPQDAEYKYSSNELPTCVLYVKY